MRRWLPLLVLACASTEDAADDDTDLETDAATDIDTDIVGETGPPDSDSDTGEQPGGWYRGGSRLQVVVWELDDDTLAFAGLHDTVLDVPCTPEVAGDGVLRCLPLRGDVSVQYADANCSDPVFFLSDDACVRSAWMRVDGGPAATCGYEDAVTMLPLRSIAAPATVYDDRPVCAAADPGASQFYDVDPLSDTPEDPAAFEALWFEDVLGDDGVGTRFLRAGDGTWAAWGYADAAGGCTPEVVAGNARCVPDERALRGGDTTFGHPNCLDTPVAVDLREAGCTQPRIVVEDAIGRPTKLYDVLGTWSGEVFTSEPSCRVTTTSDPWYELGLEVDPATLPLMSRVAVGSGDLKLRVWRDADDVPLGVESEAPTFELADGSACRPERTGVDAWICLPDGAVELFGVVWFADEACTEPVFDVEGTVGFVRGDVCEGASGRGVTAVYDLGQEYVGRLYQGLGACVASVHTDDVPLTYWRGTEVQGAYPELVQAQR